MKKIKYLLMNEVNHGTEEEPNIVPTFVPKETDCGNDTFEANYTIAKAEAYNGEVTVEEVPDPETPAPSGGDSSIWDEMDAAYQEGVDSV